MKNNKVKKRIFRNVRDITITLFIFSILGNIACVTYGGASRFMMMMSISSLVLSILSNKLLKSLYRKEKLAVKRMFIRPTLANNR